MISYYLNKVLNYKINYRLKIFNPTVKSSLLNAAFGDNSIVHDIVSEWKFDDI